MFGWFTKSKRFVNVEPKFTLEQTPSGKYAIVHTTDGIVGTYTRKADAVRGATRKGITLANA